MSSAPASRVDERSGDGGETIVAGLANSLEMAATFVAALAISLAAIGPGHPPSDPETGFNIFLTWFAVALWSLSRFLNGKMALPPFNVVTFIALFAFFTGLAVSKAAWEPYSGSQLVPDLSPLADGDGQIALDLGTAWLSHLLLFFVIFDLSRDERRMRLFLSALFASAAAVALYGLYQRGWGLPYFRRFFQENPLAAQRTAGGDPATQRALSLRIASDRVYGPFGYQNALAGYLLIFLPGWFGFWRRGASRRALLTLSSAICLICLVFSGSKAAILTAKVIETAMFIWLMPARSLKCMVAALAGVTLATLAASGCALAAWQASAFLLEGHWRRTLAETAFALAWAFEVWWLGERAREGMRLQRWVMALGLGVVLLIIVGCGMLLCKPALPENSSLGALRRLQSEIKLMTAVRSQYWIAACRMIAAHPLRGVGLDNFGCRYPEYKNPQGWPVRRAHNHYLQLAADGGLLLLAAFLAAMFAILRGNVLRLASMTAPDMQTENQHRLLGIISGLAAFAITYYLFSRGIFLGLSLEFCLREMRPDGGEWLAALGHGSMHLLALPLIWASVFSASWQALTRVEILPWLRWGLLATLLHAAADFHLSFASISMIFWTAAALACGMPARPFRLSKAARLALLPVLLLAVMVWGMVATATLQGAVAARLAENSRELLATASAAEYAARLSEAMEKHEDAMAARPRDAELRRHYADLFLLQIHRKVESLLPKYSPAEASQRAIVVLRSMAPEEKDKVMRGWRETVERSPYFADAYAQTSRRLLFLYPGEERAIEQARKWLEAAIALAPTRALYRLELARLLRGRGDEKAAAKAASMALALDCLMTDTQARLSAADAAEAEDLAARGDKK